MRYAGLCDAMRAVRARVTGSRSVGSRSSVKVDSGCKRYAVPRRRCRRCRGLRRRLCIYRRPIYYVQSSSRYFVDCSYVQVNLRTQCRASSAEAGLSWLYSLNDVNHKGKRPEDEDIFVSALAGSPRHTHILCPESLRPSQKPYNPHSHAKMPHPAATRSRVVEKAQIREIMYAKCNVQGTESSTKYATTHNWS